MLVQGDGMVAESPAMLPRFRALRLVIVLHEEGRVPVAGLL